MQFKKAKMKKSNSNSSHTNAEVEIAKAYGRNENAVLRLFSWSIST